MPKKNRISGFIIFAKEKIQGGHKPLSLKVREATPLWEKLSDLEKNVYNDRAKTIRKEETGESSGDGGASSNASSSGPKTSKRTPYMCFVMR